MSEVTETEEANVAVVDAPSTEASSTETVAIPRWKELDQQVKEGAKKFVEVGLALIEIRKKKLYVEAGFDTFGAYVKDRIDMSEQQTLKIRNAAQFHDEFKTANVKVLPTTEGQIRVLGKFKKSQYKEQRREIWEAAVKESEDKNVPLTAKLVEEKARELVPDRFKASDAYEQKQKDEASQKKKQLKEVLAFLKKKNRGDLAKVIQAELGED